MRRAGFGRRAAWCFWAVLAWAAAARGDEVPPGAAVASAHPLATEAGLVVLAEGGNAFDAAVAVAAALAVVEPYGSGLGGGGFFLLHRAADGRQLMLDARETAPAAARAALFLDEAGRPVPERSRDGPLAAGIPGVPAALDHLARRYGRLPLARSLAPALRLARDGFPVDERYRKMAAWRLPVLARHPASRAQFLVDGEVPPAGHVLRQPDLAATLERLAEGGAAAFYRGPLADTLVEGVRAAGGVWRREDLADYRVVERAPVRGRFGEVEIVAAAPPSSGGVVLIEALNIIERFPWEALDEVDRIHLVVEALRRAYRDRAEYLGDPDFVDMPLERLLHPYYAAGLAASIRFDRALPSAWLPGAPAAGEGPQTTHFSVLDAEGNRVAATLSINLPFGSGFTVPGTGVLLNDEMDDFAMAPGVPNAYGLVAGAANPNAVAPGKRMLSSMTPAFLESPDRLALIGTPGGSRIISMVLLGTLAFAAGAEAEAIVAAGRYHHQFLPDCIEHEPGLWDDTLRRALAARGHCVEAGRRRWGNMQLVIWDKRAGRLQAAADPRGIGAGRVRLRADQR